MLRTALAILLLCATAFALKYNGNQLNKLLSMQRESLSVGRENVIEGWFDQRLDHFNALHTETWKQRYFIDDSRYQANGPVFLVIGGEGPASSYYVTGTVAAYYAQQYNGIAVALEHRFYGQSMPRKDLSTENLQYLSTEQAITDLAVFRQFIAQKYNTSTFIPIGGSYAGSLAAYARIKFPQLFMGAIASSGPVRAKIDFFEYMDVVADSLGPACTAKLRQITVQIEQMLSTPEGKKAIESMFPLCKGVIGNTELDLATFFEDISDPICGIVQYNSNRQYNITKFCADLNTSTDPIRLYSNVVSKELGRCVEDSYQDYMQKMLDTSVTGNMAASRAWSWQYCTEYGYLQSAIGTKQPFSHHITVDYFLKGCEDMFGVPGLKPNAEYINTVFGADHPASSNIIFTNGLTDPWHALSVLRDIGNSQIAVVMPGQSHCSDFSMPRTNDTPALREGRVKVNNIVAQWLRK